MLFTPISAGEPLQLLQVVAEHPQGTRVAFGLVINSPLAVETLEVPAALLLIELLHRGQLAFWSPQ